MATVRSTPFLSSGTDGHLINASGVVPVSASRFVFVDNADPGALLELNLTSDGTQDGAVVRRRLLGVAPGALSDPEGIARVDTAGAINLIVASSLSVKKTHVPGRLAAHQGLVRVRYSVDGDLRAESMPGFRDWLIAAYPLLAASATRPPDQNGLNIEGVAWDPARRALLLGLRSPVTAERIPVLCVSVDLDAPWSTAALRPGPTLFIEKSDVVSPQGIRDIDYDPTRREFLVLVGRSVSSGTAPFQLCTWDGSASKVTVLDVAFAPSTMKPEGVTVIPGGVRKLLFVDDAGGFAVLDDSP